jgi:hypothetical protein
MGVTMKDIEMRKIVLQKYYDDRRRKELFCPSVDCFGGQFSMQDIVYISKQLAEMGLIEWQSIDTIGEDETGFGKISLSGVNEVEGKADSDGKVEFVPSKIIYISGSSGVVVGDDNHQSISPGVGENAGSKGFFGRLSKHPLVTAVTGGAIALFGN